MQRFYHYILQLWLINTKEPIYHRPYQGNMLESTILWGLLENVPSTGEILVAW